MYTSFSKQKTNTKMNTCDLWRHSTHFSLDIPTLIHYLRFKKDLYYVPPLQPQIMGVSKKVHLSKHPTTPNE